LDVEAGGKSYDVAGICGHCLTHDGIKSFTKKDYEMPSTAEVAVGAAITDKSSDLIKKITEGLYLMGTDKDLGVWGNPRDVDYEPNPFWRSWVGDVKPGNKKNPFRYEYEVDTANGWQKEGTATALYHINYSEKKADGDQAAAGGRYNICVYEEVGLMPNFIDALQSNVGTVSVDGEQMGVQIALGTSGNIELVQQSKKVFNNPRDYNFLAFDNIWEDDEHAKEIGLFLPVYLSDLRFKDQNGNTDVERALKFYMDSRMKAAAKLDPVILHNEKMNYPIIPSDMWISNKGSYFPQMELTERERELLKDNKFRSYRPIDLLWDSTQPNGVRADLNQTKEPFYEFPFKRSMGTIEGCPIIFHEPEYINGKIPDDMYLFTLDPYVSDDLDTGGSVGAFYGYLNPKYWKQGFKQTMVCSYVGKNVGGKDGFNEICEKLIAYYGNCPRSFWFEGIRGNVKDYFLRKDKLYLLALEPTRSRGSNAYAKKVQQYGVNSITRESKIEMIDDTAEWLLSVCWDNKRVVETIPCIFLVRQLMQFDLKQGNFDAVSSFIIFPLALKEIQHVSEQEVKNKNKHNPLAIISMNPNMFKGDETQRVKQKYEQINQQYR